MKCLNQISAITMIFVIQFAGSAFGKELKATYALDNICGIHQTAEAAVQINKMGEALSLAESRMQLDFSRQAADQEKWNLAAALSIASMQSKVRADKYAEASIDAQAAANKTSGVAEATSQDAYLQAKDLTIITETDVTNKQNALRLSFAGQLIVNFEAKTVTIKGKEFSGAESTNRESLIAAGFDRSALDDVAVITKAVQEGLLKKLKKIQIDDKSKFKFCEAELPIPNPLVSESPASAAVATAPTELPKPIEITPFKVSGYATNFNGEPIGVSVDNIFSMINRSYSQKAKQDFFILEGD